MEKKPKRRRKIIEHPDTFLYKLSKEPKEPAQLEDITLALREQRIKEDWKNPV